MTKYILTLWILTMSSITLAGTKTNQTLPESYVWFEERVESLVTPLAGLMEPGKASLPIEGVPSDHDALADRLEAFTRPGLLIALWLQMKPLPDNNSPDRQAIAAWYREALVMGTDPDHDEYFGDLRNFHQHAVEMAILTISLDSAREWLWDPLTKEQRDRVAAWLGQIRGNARPWNNHLFFNVLTLEFLQEHGYGEEGDRGAVNYLLNKLQSMHHGGGWFIDGINETFDHYNAYAFHTYGLYWAYRFGEHDPERAKWWKDRAADFIKDYSYFYAASGEHLPFGRSITYRFNGIGVFGLAAMHGIDSVPLGQMRRICRKNMDFFLSRPIQQQQGVLSVGWSNEFEPIAEPYSCAGSPYWASKGLMMLLLPPSHPFWSVQEEPYPAETNDNFARVLPAPGFVVRGVGGEVEMLNAGTRCSNSAARRFGAWKWSKVAYRTGMGFLVAENRDLYPLDCALTAWAPGNPSQRFGRHPVVPTAVTGEYLSYTYCFGEKDIDFYPQFHTYVWWNKGWLLTLHLVDAHDPAILSLGSYALGSDTDNFTVSESVFPHAHVEAENRHIAIQSLAGFDATFIDHSTDPQKRRHLNNDCHIVASLRTLTVKGSTSLAALLWAGSDKNESAPWELQKAETGSWHLQHPTLGDWKIEHPSLPSLPTPKP